MSQSAKTENPEQMHEFIRELTAHQSQLRSFVGYLLGGRVDGAEDLTQEVNLLLWQKHKLYEPGTNFRAWAFAMARYVVMGHQRRMRKSGTLIFDQDLIDRLAEEWQAEPEHHERKIAALECCFEKLSDADQDLIRIRYKGHGELKQMADHTETAAGNLRLRLFRLRAAIKRCIETELETEAQLS